MANTSRLKYLAKNTMLFSISSFSSKILSFLMVPLYTYKLSTSEYGSVDIVLTTSTLLMHVFTLNIAMAVLRFVLEDVRNQFQALRISIRIIAIGACMLSLSVFGVYYLSLFEWDEFYYCFLIAIFLSESVSSLLSSFLRALDKINILVVTSIISTFSRLGICILALVVFDAGPFGFLLSVVFGSLVSILFAVWSVFPIDKESNLISEADLRKDMLSYSVPTVFNSLGWWIANCIDKYLITGLKGTALNGVYSIAYKIPMMLTVFCDIFSEAWILSAIKEYKSSDRTPFYGQIYSVYKGGLLLICSIIILLNIPLATILYSNDFFEASKYVPLLVVAMCLGGMSSFIGGIFSAAKKTKILSISTIISAFVNLLFNALLIPKFDAYGAAFATLVSFYTIWIIRIYYSKKYVDLDISLLKDHCALFLICVQVYCDSCQTHVYYLQFVILIAILIMYYSQITLFTKKIGAVLKSKF